MTPILIDIRPLSFALCSLFLLLNYKTTNAQPRFESRFSADANARVLQAQEHPDGGWLLLMALQNQAVLSALDNDGNETMQFQGPFGQSPFVFSADADGVFVVLQNRNQTEIHHLNMQLQPVDSVYSYAGRCAGWEKHPDGGYVLTLQTDTTVSVLKLALDISNRLNFVSAWQTRQPTLPTELFSRVAPDGGQFLAGNLAADRTFVASFSSEGSFNWSREMPSTGENWMTAALSLPDGSFVFSLYTNAYKGNAIDELDDDINYDVLLARIGTDGRTQWARRTGGRYLIPDSSWTTYYQEWVTQLALAPDGKLLAFGTKDYYEGMLDPWVMVADANDGRWLREARFGSMEPETGEALAIKDNGDLLLLSNRYQSRNSTVFALALDTALSVQACIGVVAFESPYALEVILRTEAGKLITSATAPIQQSQPASPWVNGNLSYESSAMKMETVLKPPLCAGGSDGSIAIQASGGTEPYQYHVSLVQDEVEVQSELYPRDSDSLITGLVAGRYAVQVAGNDRCWTMDFITLTEPDSLRWNTDSSGSRCPDSAFVVKLWPTGGTAPYVWPEESTAWGSLNGDTLSASFQLAENRSLFLADNNQCPLDTTLDYVPGPEVNTGTPDTFELSDQVVSLRAAEPVGGLWSGLGISDNEQGRLDLSYYADSGLYTVYYAFGGCIRGREVLLTQVEESTISNVFTPNGDGQNDFFYGLPNGWDVGNLVVVDVWGREWHTGRSVRNAPNTGWSGQDAPTGIYFFKIQSGKQVKLGQLQLLR